MASCFFIGHRETDASLLPKIKSAAERLIQQQQVSNFYVGMYGNFDSLAGEAIIQLKHEYPDVRLFLVIPYHPADRPIEAPPGYDGTFYPDDMESVSRRYAIVKANRKMIDTCDGLIAYVTHTVSNAYDLLAYALRREKRGLIHVIPLGKGNAAFQSKKAKA
ncbi:MAG: hypothetical protein IJ189_00450 [Clostridia bacterium]|nr:hypothetical protein [Clostridia bacterium]